LHILTLGVAPYAASKYSGRFRHNAFFIGSNVRDAVLQGEADYTPVFLSEVPRLFRSGRVRIDVALIQVSPPDRNGYCSYGIAVDVVKAGAESAKLVIAAVNPRMPRTHGDSFIHVDEIDYGQVRRGRRPLHNDCRTRHTKNTTVTTRKVGSRTTPE
jgi:acyl-CoA hydrolase